LYVRTAILPNPPSFAFFTKIPGKWLMVPSIIDIKYGISDEECANLCLANYKCLSFDYSDSKSIYFYFIKHENL